MIHTINGSNDNRISSKEEKNSNLNVNDSKEERKEHEDVSSNLNSFVDADVAAADEETRKIKVLLKAYQ